MNTLNDSKSLYKKRIMICITVIALLCISHIGAVYAAESTDILLLKTLRSYGIDSTSNIGIDMLRRIGFESVKGLGSMMDSLYSMIGTIYKYLSFTTSDQLMGLLTRYEALYKSVFIVSLVFFGIYLIRSKASMDQLNTVNCILIIIFVIAAMPLFAEKMTNLTVTASDYAKSQWTEYAEDSNVDSIASTILTSNIVDLKKVDDNISGQNISGLKKDEAFNNLKDGTDDWKMLSINATMDYDDDSFKSDIWSKELEMEESGQYEITDLDAGLLNTYYYRYQIISWFNIFAELISAAIVLFFVCFKCATLIFDIAMSMIYAPFVALTDLTTGQRTKEVLKNFMVLYATIFLCVALLGAYFAAFGFINNNINKTFPKIIMHIALAWVTMGGPNVLERITGVDVGSKGAWQKVMGARALFGIAAGAGKAAAKTAEVAGKAGRAAGNVLAGKERIDNAMDKMSDMKDNAVKEATDGKGLLGFGQNVASGVRDKVTPSDSTKGVENIAKKADKDFGKTVSRRPDKKSDNLNSNLRNTGMKNKGASLNSNLKSSGTKDMKKK